MLRRNATSAERTLWYHLRNRNLEGYKFRRHHAIASYVVDFFCEDARLVIELDGFQHEAPDGIRRDAERTAHLEALGLRVLRFRNDALAGDLGGVLDAIRKALTETPHPNPLP
jgi:very-short-patch-repair endonuclease